MKNTTLMLLLALLSISCSPSGGSGSLPKGAISTVEGTGVSFVVPPGLRQGPLGSYFVDSSGETILQFQVGAAPSTLENDAIYRALYPDPPEKFRNAHLSGHLYKRVRAVQGGKYDGWWLEVTQGTKVLDVLAMYTGHDGDRFDRLKSLFTDLSWDEGQVDAELAFGAHVSPPPHLRVITGGAGGGLGFSASGRPDPPGPSLVIVPMPVPDVKGGSTIQAEKCASVFANSFRTGSYAGPFVVKENGIAACDGWGVESDGRTKYMGVMLMPNGAMLTVMGWGDPDQFRASLMHMRMTRAPQPLPATSPP